MGETFYKVSHATIGMTMRAAWRVRHEGRDNVPKEGGAILASNHLSYIDSFLMPAVVPRPVYFISKQEHFQVPVQRWFFRQWGVIPLQRGAADSHALVQAEELLREGKLFGIYPEGTRSLDGKLHKGHTGAARLALKVGVPVIPVAMVGTFEALPKGKRMPKFNRCTVRFGRPLDFTRLHGLHDDRATTRKVTDEIMQAIRDVSGQEYVNEYQRNPEYKTREEQARGEA